MFFNYSALWHMVKYISQLSKFDINLSQIRKLFSKEAINNNIDLCVKNEIRF